MRIHIILFSVVCSVACTEPNQAFCCETEAQCAMLGVGEIRDCAGAQVCDNGTCSDPQCTTSADCTSPEAPFCTNQLCVGACRSDDDCVGVPGEPHCATNGVCVGCLGDDQCGTGLVCDDTSHECRGCVADDECASTVCDLDAKSCIAASSITYAAPDGTSAACSQTAPCALTDAIALASSNTTRSTLRMTPGNYTAGLSVVGGSSFSIVATGAHLTGGVPVTGVTGVSSVNVLVGAGANATIRGLEIQPDNTRPALLCTAPSGSTAAVILRQVAFKPDATGGAAIISTRCQAHIDRVDFAETPLAIDGGTTAVDRSKLLGLSGGLVLSGTAFRTLTVTNSAIGEIDVPSSGQHQIDISFSTIFGRQGVQPGGATPTGITFANNIITNAIGLPDSVECSTCTFTNNLFFPQTTTIPNNVVIDPRFVDPTQGDLHLRSDSPAIDAASTVVGTTDHDFDGTVRPQGLGADLGAFEFHP